MVAIGLIFGDLTADHYQDQIAADPRIDELRAKMQVRENPDFTVAYYDPDQRAIPNSVQVFFRDGSQTERVAVHFPVGHRRRREEGLPLLRQKFAKAVEGYYNPDEIANLISLFGSPDRIDQMPADDFMAMFYRQPAPLDKLLA
jgi:2-methylcitrate dehydratase